MSFARAARRRVVRAERKATKRHNKRALIAAVSARYGRKVGWKATRKFLKRQANQWRRAIEQEHAAEATTS